MPRARKISALLGAEVSKKERERERVEEIVGERGSELV